MKTSTALALAGAVGVGLYFITKNQATPTATVPPPAKTGVTIPAVVADPGPVVPQLGAAYAVLKPIATYITTPAINKINSAVGGVTPFGGVSNVHTNADGTATGTDGLGATVVFHPDGTITRHNPPWQQTNGGKVIVAVGNGVKHAAQSVAHWLGF